MKITTNYTATFQEVVDVTVEFSVTHDDGKPPLSEHDIHSKLELSSSSEDTSEGRVVYFNQGRIEKGVGYDVKVVDSVTEHQGLCALRDMFITEVTKDE